MEVKCIDEGGNFFIKLGKVYDVENESNMYYWIINEEGEECRYSKKLFKIVKENNMKFKKEDLNGLMLFKLRRQGLCALLPNEINGNTLYNKEYLQSGISGGLLSVSYYDSDLKCFNNSYDIIAIKKFDSGNSIISLILNDNEPDEWDWVREEKTEQEIKLENVISGLQEQLEKAKYELSNIKKGI